MMFAACKYIYIYIVSLKHINNSQFTFQCSHQRQPQLQPQHIIILYIVSSEIATTLLQRKKKLCLFCDNIS